jgi:hypothetical protein
MRTNTCKALDGIAGPSQFRAMRQALNVRLRCCEIFTVLLTGKLYNARFLSTRLQRISRASSER